MTTPTLTTASGAPVPDNQNTLTAGACGTRCLSRLRRVCICTVDVHAL
jgi:catalase